MTLLTLAFAAYALTFVVVSSSLFEPIRSVIIKKTTWLRIGNNKHPIECRMCFGFWASATVCLVTGNWVLIAPVYGASYFLATQER